jgi:CBS-domain-containing membrane protein
LDVRNGQRRDEQDEGERQMETKSVHRDSLELFCAEGTRRCVGTVDAANAPAHAAVRDRMGCRRRHIHIF